MRFLDKAAEIFSQCRDHDIHLLVPTKDLDAMRVLANAWGYREYDCFASAIYSNQHRVIYVLMEGL